MALYVLICIDKLNSFALRMATREAHLAYVRETPHARLKVGGPFLGKNGEMTGSLLIAEAKDPAAAEAFAADDPYGKAGLFASVEIRPWKVTAGTLS